MSKPVKRSVAVVVSDKRRRILLVQRPADDEELPGAWGLPASSLQDSETWTDAALRCGADKLGARLDRLAKLNEGSQERATYTLRMTLFQAEITDGAAPVVPQPMPGVTQYAACRWASPGDARADLEASAAKGSLCCELWLASSMGDWSVSRELCK